MPAHRTSRPLFARFYARVSPAMDAGGMAARRQRLLEGLRLTLPTSTPERNRLLYAVT